MKPPPGASGPTAGRRAAHRSLRGPTLFAQGRPQLQSNVTSPHGCGLPIHLQATYPALGGERWWFACPLVFNGVACHRRVGKIYLSPGARYFGCRHCHGLTCESSQEAHCGGRLFALLGEKLGIDPRIAKRLASRLGKKRVK
jgi:hypothetical protein